MIQKTKKALRPTKNHQKFTKKIENNQVSSDVLLVLEDQPQDLHSPSDLLVSTAWTQFHQAPEGEVSQDVVELKEDVWWHPDACFFFVFRSFFVAKRSPRRAQSSPGYFRGFDLQHSLLNLLMSWNRRDPFVRLLPKGTEALWKRRNCSRETFQTIRSSLSFAFFDPWISWINLTSLQQLQLEDLKSFKQATGRFKDSQKNLKKRSSWSLAFWTKPADFDFWRYHKNARNSENSIYWSHQKGNFQRVKFRLFNLKPPTRQCLKIPQDCRPRTKYFARFENTTRFPATGTFKSLKQPYMWQCLKIPQDCRPWRKIENIEATQISPNMWQCLKIPQDGRPRRKI